MIAEVPFRATGARRVASGGYWRILSNRNEVLTFGTSELIPFLSIHS